MDSKFITVNDLEIFYREAGSRNNPTIVLLHGYPSSSYMFRSLIPILAEQYHLVAPDYPGFGYTTSPQIEAFEYSFDNLASLVEQWLDKLSIDRYFLYVQDYGAPIGYRIASTHPERVLGLIIQNGNAYKEGLSEAWAPIKAYWQDKSEQNAQVLQELCTPEFIQHMYLNGVSDPTKLSPDTWTLDRFFLQDDERKKIQIELFYDYQSNVEKYPEWQEYFRAHQPPALVVWGKNDMFFTPEGAESYCKDLVNVDSFYYDTGHFALEECCKDIADKILQFSDQVVAIG